MKFFVYILECADKSLYVGCTNDLQKRLQEHNESKRGAHYTKIRRPVTLQYSEAFDSLGDARAREAKIKSWSREKKLDLMKKQKTDNQIVIYQAKSGAIEFRGDVSRETIWATLDQIAKVFGRDKSVISRHLGNIYKEGKLDTRTTVAKNATVQMEGKRSIERVIEYYNLDAIISVGYRVNSKKATQFRIWATKTLKNHIFQGYTINPKRIAQNYDAFIKAVADIQTLLPEHITLDPKVVLDLVKEFASTWVSLDAYDKDALIASGATKKNVAVTAEQLASALGDFKRELFQGGRASELFGQERHAHAVAGIVGNVI